MADLHDLLEKTSRTFALSIPYLPEPTRREVTIAYLLFRIADTFEDSVSWTREERMAALEMFCQVLDPERAEEVRRQAEAWAQAVPIEHAGYQELMVETPFVLEAYYALSPAARELVREHTVRTARGMAGYVARTGDDGVLHLRDLDDLREYCYVVAGIVGEMLTELFLLDRGHLAGAAAALRARSRHFGEALQLVNILKDSAFDATEGRSYLPPDAERGRILELARADLEASVEYVETLRAAGAERGLVAFNALNTLLAFATLEKLEREGPGAKISRPRVYRIVENMEDALDRDLPLFERAAGEVASVSSESNGGSS